MATRSLDNAVSNITNISKKDFIHEFETGKKIKEQFFDERQGKIVEAVANEIAEVHLKKGETKPYPSEFAMEIAYHLAQVVASERKIDKGMFNVYDTEGKLNMNSEHVKIMLEILGKEKVDYSPLSREELMEIAKEKGIKLRENMKRDEIIRELTQI